MSERPAELVVHATGLLSTVQDLGRPGLAGLGVPRSGGADRASLRLANRLLGNPEGAPVVEATLGGLEVGLTATRWCVVTGADAPVEVDGTPVGVGSPFVLRAGARLRVGSPAHGLRSYLAVRGGLAVAPVLGSASQDVLSGIAPLPLGEGTRVPLGRVDEVPVVPVDVAPVRMWSGDPVLEVDPGPRRDWVSDEAWRTLTSAVYEVSSRSDRVGVRLSGPAVERAVHAELPSEGVVPGAVQVPPSGEPVVFLADHPTTGGYPVCAVVVPASLPLLAQLVPGQGVRLRPARR
ncbi:5-oxoprolinase subunit C family protein [Janibacter melonis]|uniref:5-oxoprolinase subunit C family protein n=1 Tax=Janibacter melonis TaxID=262209 RepID=UPI00174C7486|nr:biotin-dependent carboxyltransferase family protein [Janibacter melonis]